VRILGIETSCDETAAAVVEDGKRLLSNVVVSQIDIHKVYGGVVPEIAARSHIEAIIPVIDEALNTAFPALSIASIQDKLAEVDGIAVTYGAGLGGSLLIGVMTARSLAIASGKPLYAINHVEAHVYANFITEVSSISHLQLAKRQTLAMSDERLKLHGKLPIANVSPIAHRPSPISTDYQLPSSAPKFPLLALIVSGGHTQLVLFKNHFDYEVLGKTQDDAIGEAFDKVAKMIGLPYPGGPSVAKKAKSGDPYKFDFPKAQLKPREQILDSRREILAGRPQISNLKSNVSYDFSFSGLKTAVLRTAQGLVGHNHTLPSWELPRLLSEAQKADIAASFQRIAVETVVDKTVAAFEEYSPASVVIAGGVASSDELRRQLNSKLSTVNCKLIFTDPKLCTDNAAMIATLGCFKASLGQAPADPYKLEIQPSLKM